MVHALDCEDGEFAGEFTDDLAGASWGVMLGQSVGAECWGVG